MANQTPNQFLDSIGREILSPIKDKEKTKASVYGALGGAALGGLAGYMLPDDDDEQGKKRKWVKALVGAGIGGIGGSVLLNQLQGRKFENNPVSSLKVEDQKKYILPMLNGDERKKLEGFYERFEGRMDKPVSSVEDIGLNKAKDGILSDIENKKKKISSIYDEKVPFFYTTNPMSTRIPYELVQSRMQKNSNKNFSKVFIDVLN